MRTRYCALLAFLFVSFNSQSQHLRFAVVRAKATQFESLRLTIGEKQVGLTLDEHAPDLNGDSLQSNMVAFVSMAWPTLSPAGIGRVIVIDPGTSPKMESNVTLPASPSANSCRVQTAVSQSTWRAGMAPPSVPPDTNEVRHLVVHHSATDNSLTDYVAVVRGIYLLHTQTNGWDDIGYNYLVAPDGTLFLGRDPQGRCRQDNVKGAHFCGKNAATMGVCLLGDFTAQAPTQAALSTLENVLGWKLAEENLHALDSALHPPGSPSAYFLKAIVGHRDGCSTACPGNMTYPALGLIRTVSDSIRNGCLAVTATSTSANLNLKVTNSRGTVSISGGQPSALYQLARVDGRIAAKGRLTRLGSAEIDKVSAGLYLLKVEGLAPRRLLVQ